MGGGGGNNGISSIPACSRKMVQSLKEIVNCPELEIYGALRDCNMDPNEAVNRLLSQDPFHEVKSKREKKKENKDTIDAKPRNSASSRGGRTSIDRYAGRGRASTSSSTDSAVLHGKTTYKKENGSHAYAGASSFASVASGNSGNQRFMPVRGDGGGLLSNLLHDLSCSALLQLQNFDPSTMENKGPAVGENDVISGSVQQPSGFQSAWFGMPGQVSMADIVKMGRPHGKVSGAANLQISRQNAVAPSVPSPSDFHPLPGQSSSKTLKPEVVVSSSQHVPAIDDWPLDEAEVPPNNEWPSFGQSHAAVSVVDPPVEAKLYGEPSNLSLDRSGHHLASQIDGAHQLSEDRPLENSNYMSMTSISSRNVQEEENQDGPLFDSNIYHNGATFQPHPQAYEHSEDEDSAGAVTGNLQQLSLEQGDEDVTAEEDGPAVVIPDHLQVHAMDCQHLSFGSFGAGIGATFSGSPSSRSLKNNIGETPPASDAAASIAQADTRNPEHYGDEHLRPTSEDVDDVHGTGTSITNYDTASVSQSEVLQPDSADHVPGNQYSFASAPGYSYDSSQSLNATFAHPQTSSQMQNLSPFSGVLPSALLQSSVQTGRESDPPYLPFPVTQSLPPKYNVASSLSSSVMLTPEAYRGSSISAAQQQQQQTTQSLLPSAASVATGPTALLPQQQQHLAMHHPYSQPTLPLAPFTNMVSYPFLPQSYSYMPSAFQQAFAAAAAGNNTFPQSLAAVLPHYKNTAVSSSLPQAASGYGFGSSSNTSSSIPGGGGSFPLNHQAGAAPPAGMPNGYDDPLTSQYNEANHLLSLQQQQQNDNSAMWMHGQGSRSMPVNNYYNYHTQQSQQQQLGSLRQQGQTPSQQQQHYGGGYFYQSAAAAGGISMEQQQQLQLQQLQQLQLQQQQMARDGSLIGSQGQQQQQPKQQQQQLWQNTY